MEPVDMLKSVRRFVHQLDPDPPKYIERIGSVDFARPSYHIKLLPVSSMPLHQSAHLDEATFAVSFFGQDMDQASKSIGKIRNVLLQDLYIPGWLFDSEKPAPELTNLMRLQLSSVNLDLLEDPDYKGQWNGVLRFTTTVQRLRFNSSNIPLMQVIGKQYDGGE